MKTVPFSPFSIDARGRLVEFQRPVVMGILNITTDSFYDGGRYRDVDAMLAQARRIVEEGADIIDLGASSSRPGAVLLPPEEEAARLEEAIKQLRSELPDILLSVDTCYSLPARVSIEAGADIINDISGGQIDSEMFHTVADMQVPYIMMHMRGTPGDMQQMTGYDDIIDDLTKYFSSRLDTLYRLGVKDVWIDPGFGFAKTIEENHELLRRLDELTTLFREPVLVGLSRKSMIYKKLDITPQEALNCTTALNTMALERGAAILRVHDVKQAVEIVKLLE